MPICWTPHQGYFDMVVAVGKTYHWLRRKYHIVAIFDDCGERFCVVKTWNRYKQWWSYSVEYMENIDELVNGNDKG